PPERRVRPGRQCCRGARASTRRTPPRRARHGGGSPCSTDEATKRPAATSALRPSAENSRSARAVNANTVARRGDTPPLREGNACRSAGLGPERSLPSPRRPARDCAPGLRRGRSRPALALGLLFFSHHEHFLAVHLDGATVGRCLALRLGGAALPPLPKLLLQVLEHPLLPPVGGSSLLAPRRVIRPDVPPSAAARRSRARALGSGCAAFAMPWPRSAGCARASPRSVVRPPRACSRISRRCRSAGEGSAPRAASRWPAPYASAPRETAPSRRRPVRGSAGPRRSLRANSPRRRRSASRARPVPSRSSGPCGPCPPASPSAAQSLRQSAHAHTAGR